MKELVLKKMTELVEIYKSVHMDIDSDHEWRILTDLIDSGSLLSLAFYPENVQSVDYRFFVRLGIHAIRLKH